MTAQHSRRNAALTRLVRDDEGAPDEAAVRAFHAAALAGGCASDRAPGPYDGAQTPYFAAFIRDPDGNRIQAATFSRP